MPARSTTTRSPISMRLVLKGKGEVVTRELCAVGARFRHDNVIPSIVRQRVLVQGGDFDSAAIACIEVSCTSRSACDAS